MQCICKWADHSLYVCIHPLQNEQIIFNKFRKTFTKWVGCCVAWNLFLNECMVCIDVCVYVYLYGFYMNRWHAAGTFDVSTKTGGPFGTIRYPQELAHGANAGLSIAVNLLQPIKDQFPILSYADFYQVDICCPSAQIYSQQSLCLGAGWTMMMWQYHACDWKFIFLTPVTYIRGLL